MYAPLHRRSGLGRKLLKHVAKLALSQGCSRMEWVVVKGNAIATQFYEKLGTWQVTHFTPVIHQHYWSSELQSNWSTPVAA